MKPKPSVKKTAKASRSLKSLAGRRTHSAASAPHPPGLQPIALPKPGKNRWKSLAACLQLRKTTREIGPQPIPLQALSNLLWAAFGVNRPEPLFMGKPGRTAASASNSQEVDLYVALPQGVYLYEAIPHRLTPVAAGDFRKLSGRWQAVEAPVNIFYVADLTRYIVGRGQPDPHIADPEVQKSYSYVGTGLIAQNVYLFAASHGFAAWFHNCDKEKTPAEFRLRPAQRVLFAQSVGYAKKA
jgi:nitroreductase